MRASWCVISCINILWCVFLWRRRRDNHPWLLAFFLTYCISDTAMLLASPASVGGFNLMGPSVLGWKHWVFVACLAWMSWLAMPILTACKLAAGRVPWWLVASLVVLCVGLSGAEYVGFTGFQRRFAMHVVSGPVMLVVALTLIAVYVSKAINRCNQIDYLSFAVAATSMIILLKLGLILDSVGMLSRWQSHTFFYMYIIVVIGSYFGQKRLRKWLRSQSH